MGYNIRREYRRWLADKVVAGIRRTRLDDKLGGFILKVLHFNAPWGLVIHAAKAPRNEAIFSLIALTVALGLYIYVGGCFLSDAEIQLGAGEFNVVDPYIQLFDQPVNKQSRYDFTIFGAALAYTLVLSFLHLRGIL